MNKQIRLLPFLFMFHNVEEVIGLYYSDNDIFTSHIHSLRQFIVAVSLFTITGFLLVFGKRLYRKEKQYQYTVLGFTGMLFLNSFFPHILSAVYFKEYTPGLLTASLVILPYTGFLLWQFLRQKIFSPRKEILTIFTGGIIGMILVYVFLGIGYIVI